ncbi:MAG TPA: type 1 glutamine amidotransferase [Xanthomonadaceae bacterium]|jgi:GMP synthase-like glutamine amidotransferase
MDERLVVVQHHPAEGIGELGVWADRNGIALDVVRADLDALPPSSKWPCVLLGGPYSVNAAPGWLRHEKLWLHEAVAADTAILGICLGSQLLAEALGGRVHPMQEPETGWTRIAFDDGSAFDALQWHEDTFTRPPGSESLACSAACVSQVFRLGNRIGIQFHPEWNAALVVDLNAHFGADSPLPRDIDHERHARVAVWFHRLLDDWRASW